MMKIFVAIKTGSIRTVKIWKGILIVWGVSLILTSMVAIPIKSALKSGFGDSMITEKLADGINIEVFADLGPVFKSLVSYFSTGLLMIIFIGFIMNSFLMGGVFESLKGSTVKFSGTEFLRASAKNFWSYLVISVIISLIVIIIAVLVIVIPTSILSNNSASSDTSGLRSWIIIASVFIILLAVMLLVADYARAWQASMTENACFKAIGFGFSRTFKTFLSSYPLMIILLIIQVFFGWFVIRILPDSKPLTGWGVFLLFVMSQFLFYIKIMLKFLRYGSVTSLMEYNNEKVE